MKRTSRAITLCLAALMCFALAACGSSAGIDEAKDTGAAAPKAYFDSESRNGAFAAEEADASGGSGKDGVSSVYTQSDVKLIRRAWMDVQSTEFDRSLAELKKLVAQLDGYFESSELYTGGYYAADGDCRTGSYVVRIPAASYDRFMASLDGIGVVTSRNESSEDVGQIYYDVESRLKTQRIKQERLQALLEQAEDMEDIIALEDALSEVEYMIESYSSDLRRYDGLIDYATITISLNEVIRLTAAPGERQPLLQRMGAGVVHSLQGLVDGLQEFLIWVSYNLIGLLFTAAVIAVIVIVIKRAVRKSKGVPAKSARNEQKQTDENAK